MPSTAVNYEHALEYLYSRINYERTQPDAPGEFKLDRIRRLLALLGDPQDRIPAVHIAGTKGKGSTAVMTAEILHAAGYRTGLFTSPHLTCFEERMRVDGRMPSPEEIVALVERLAGPVAQLDAEAGRTGPTFFEITTALAWLHFERCGVQIAVMEVGLGGRLDATNVCRPEVTVITTISRDHTTLLGSTTAEIAAEKAGIVKPGVPLISGVTADEPRGVIEAICRRQGAPLVALNRDLHVEYHPGVWAGGSKTRPQPPAAGQSDGTVDVQTPWRRWTGLPVPLAGAHQGQNAGLAVCAMDALRERGWNISDEAVRAGLNRVVWPARIEILGARPTVIVDAAHNWAAVGALIQTLRARPSDGRRLLVFAGTRDKDVSGLLRQLIPEFDTLIFTQYVTNPRAMPAEQLFALAQSLAHVPGHVAPEPAAAWKLASRLARPEDLICIAGSFFIAAELRELILAEQRENASSADSVAQQHEAHA
jgi:dihydrofolate synthase / folylpolyglutamate synthase